MKYMTAEITRERFERKASEAEKTYVERDSRCPRAPLSGKHFWIYAGVVERIISEKQVERFWVEYCFKCGYYARGFTKGDGQ